MGNWPLLPSKTSQVCSQSPNTQTDRLLFSLACLASPENWTGHFVVKSRPCVVRSPPTTTAPNRKESRSSCQKKKKAKISGQQLKRRPGARSTYVPKTQNGSRRKSCMNSLPGSPAQHSASQPLADLLLGNWASNRRSSPKAAEAKNREGKRETSRPVFPCPQTSEMG